ncbi:DUF4064 domain-containing protein [Caldibacillus lycopersici]|uniref:DUF4064 domain-containing protein n=1 Tax=Perspicuibacillus lycopersici TaxID=1325689 RepID=A0AAE3LS49_9BACI|nr:DUF4064 domain-containing protein [Perspicuibacillus lycopersici]MCU9612373.1 DUF4064 domain-containing protein [Perspicuibacillus lycopersici]
MSRTTEFVLGLLGGIIGVFAAFFALLIGGVDAAFSSDGSSDITGLGWFAIIFSIVGIVGASMVKGKTRLAGILMIISAIGGLISISMFYLVSAILLLIAGLMAVFKKNKKATT